MERKIKYRLLEKLRDSWEETNKNLMVVGASFAIGVGLSKLGKAVNLEQIAAVPPIMDLLGGGRCISLGTIPYLVGVAAGYATEMYEYLVR